MKKTKILLPILGVAASISAVAPLVVTTGCAKNSQSEWFGPEVFIPKTKYAPAVDIKQWGLSDKEAADLYFEEIKSNKDIFADDFHYAMSAELIQFNEDWGTDMKSKISNVEIDAQNHRVSYKTGFKCTKITKGSTGKFFGGDFEVEVTVSKLPISLEFSRTYGFVVGAKYDDLLEDTEWSIECKATGKGYSLDLIGWDESEAINFTNTLFKFDHSNMEDDLQPEPDYLLNELVGQFIEPIEHKVIGSRGGLKSYFMEDVPELAYFLPDPDQHNLRYKISNPDEERVMKIGVNPKYVSQMTNISGFAECYPTSDRIKFVERTGGHDVEFSSTPAELAKGEIHIKPYVDKDKSTIQEWDSIVITTIYLDVTIDSVPQRIAVDYSFPPLAIIYHNNL